MEKGLVSIITPVYNAERFVGATISSVLSQTYSNWEMILINDGSTDKSVDVIIQMQGKDRRIKLFNQVNAGCASARNKGIREANGQFICLLDADDLWEPNFLESQLTFMKNEQAQLVFCSHSRIDENGKEILKPFLVPKQVTYKDMLKTCSISCLTGVYDTETYGKFFLNEDFKSLRDDYLYWLAILKKTKIAYGNHNILAHYRILSNSTSRNKLKVIVPQFKALHEAEGLNIVASCYYLTFWAINGFLKYRR